LINYIVWKLSFVEIYKYKNKTISVDVKIIKVQRIQPVKMYYSLNLATFLILIDE